MKPKKLLSFILAMVMTISLLPTFTLTASATTTMTAKNITLGDSALHDADTTNAQWDYVYYGTYNGNPIKWRVLSTEGNSTTVGTKPNTATYKTADGEAYTDNALFMLSENTLFDTWFYGTTYDNAWLTSNLRDKMQKNIFSDDSDELKYVLKTTKTDSSETIGYLNPYNNMAQYTIDWGESSLSDDTLFALSAREVEQYLGSGEKYANRASGDAAWWWLRSPGDFNYVGCVDEDGLIFDFVVDFPGPAARPAFNLNLSSVLFTSAAVGGKSSTAAAGGGAEISKNADYTISGDEKYEYKLTMLDTSRNFEITEKNASGTKGEKITFDYENAEYENAETGSNEYISAMIVNNNDEVLYYGQIKNLTDSNDEGGTVDFTIPSDIDYGTYKLKLFNEQINGDYKTDYSSDFQTVTLSVEKPKATFITVPKPNILTYNGEEQALVTAGETSDGTVKYSLEKDGTYTTDIPTGKKAKDYEVWYYIEGDSTHSDSDKASIDVTISPKDIANATITLGDSLTYNGTEQTQKISKVEVDGLTLKNTDYTISDNKGTEAKDDYELTISGIGNFTGTAKKQFAIAKADSQTTTTADSTVTYGETLNLTATVEKSARTLNKVDFYVVEGENAEPLGTADVTYTDGTNGTATLTINTTDKKLKIGDNKITAEYGGSVNLNESKSDTITVTLNKKEIGLSWSGYAARDYDGQPSNVAATATGTLGKDEISVTVTGGKEANANTYTATATGLTGTYAEYYKLPTVVTKNYTISPKNISGADVGTFAEMTYNGNEQTPSATVTIDGLTATGEWSNVTNVSDKTTFTANGNFTGTIENQSTGMKPLPVIIGWENTEGLVFNNTEKTISAEVSNRKDGDVINLTITGDLTGTNKGTYTATVTAVDNENYTIENGQNLEKEWVISQADDNIITGLAIDDWTYGDTANTPTATAKYGTPTFAYSEDENSGYAATVPTNAGTYWVKATVAGTEDYAEVSSVPISFEIAQATPTENPDKKTTARVKRNRTLAEATVTEGEILGLNDMVLDGTFVWVDDTTTMSADGTEQMTFTPTDTNYAPITVNVAVSTYSSSGGGSSVTRYTVKFDTDGGSTITSQTVTKNSKATEPTKPTKEGYIFDGWYTDSEFTTEYDFSAKVTKNITLYAKWSEDEIQEPSDDKKDDEPQTDEWKNPFTDVKENDWFFDNVKYANENGLMSGVTNTTFAPNDSLTRAMLVTVLWRAEGEPNVDFAMPFTDVIDTAYYAEAVRWAASENIVNGVTETEFAPDMNITREQIAAIIYRYATYKGYDVSVGEDTNILSYADFDEISEYAIEAVQYAVGSGLMKGKTETTLNPKDNATRAEIAAILNRFIEGNK